MAEVDHLLQHDAHALRTFGCEQERPVDLHDVERQLVQQREVAVAAAEIVHVDGKAHGMERGDDGNRVLAESIIGEIERRLRELELDALRRIAVDERLHAREIALLAHVDAALVHGNRHDGQAFFRRFALEPHDLLEVVEIEVGDEAVALEERDELARRQKAELGALPAHECLGTDAAPRPEIVFRLIPDLELLPFERLPLEAFHACREHGLLLEAPGKELHGLFAMCGDVGVIDGRADVFWRLAEVADARLERHAHEHAADFEIFIGAQEASEADAELVARHGMREAEELGPCRPHADELGVVRDFELAAKPLEERDDGLAAIRAHENIRPHDAQDDDSTLRCPHAVARDERRSLAFEPLRIVQARRMVMIDEALHVRFIFMPHRTIPPEREDGDERDGKDGEHDILRIRIEAPASSPFSSR